MATDPNNPIAQLLSFFNPQANRSRLEGAGVYSPRQAPVNSPQQGSAYSVGAQSNAAPANYTIPTGDKRYNVATAKEIIDRYTKAGFDPRWAAGQAANSEVESSGNPEAFNPKEGAFGIFQHTPNGGRATNLRDFAGKANLTADNLGAQIDFSIYEYRTYEEAAYKSIIGADPQTAGEYAAAIDKYWERSDGRARDRRVALADQIYSDFYGPNGNSIATPSGNTLTFGSVVGAQDPMTATPEQLPYDMGRAATAADFAFDGPASLAKLNVGKPDNGGYDDAIMRFLRNPAPEDAPSTKNAAEAYNGQLSFGNAQGGGNIPLNMSAGSASTAAGPDTAPAQAATSEATPPKRDAIERFMDKMYGTKDTTDLSDDERRDRKRAVGLALADGFSSLSNGSEADYAGIAAQRMELQQVRRANTALKGNAQGVSDMLVAAGYSDRAKLPFMGQEGMNAAMAMLGAIPSKGSSDQLDPALRAAAAQTLADNGQTAYADALMTAQGPAAVKLFENVISGTLPGVAKDGEKSAMSPEQIAGAAALLAQTDPRTAAMFPYMDDKTRNDVMLAHAKVVPGAQEAVAVAGGQAGVTEAVNADSAEALAAGYDSAGMSDEAAAVRAAGSYEEGKQVVADMQKQREKSATDATVAERGKAVAAVIPDSLPNAKALKAAAKAALTSEDLNAVYAQITPTKPSETQALYEIAKKDPAFMKFMVDLNVSKSGKDPTKKRTYNMLMDEVGVYAEGFAASKNKRSQMRAAMETVVSLAKDLDYAGGVVQGTIIAPVQNALNSVFGDAAVDLMSDKNLTMFKIVEQVQNANFALMGSELKGSASEMESKAFMNSMASTTSSRVQALAMSQYLIRGIDLQEAEYAAMTDWLSTSEGTAEEGDRAAMLAYIKEKTKDIKVFADVPVQDPANVGATFSEGLQSGKFKPGEVIRVIDATGAAVFMIVPG